MARGGYQKPKNPAPVSGPGKFSKRTDGKIVEPDIDKERGLQYGDRERLVEAQRIAKTAVGAGARVAPTAGGARRMTGELGGGGSLPPWFTSTPDTHPAEPTTAGLDMGPGPGREILDASAPADDLYEQGLIYLKEVLGNPDIDDMLFEYREQRAARFSAQSMAASAGSLPQTLV